MLKDFAWNAFKSTGNVDAYILYKEIEEKNKAVADRQKAEEEVAISN